MSISCYGQISIRCYRQIIGRLQPINTKTIKKILKNYSNLLEIIEKINPLCQKPDNTHTKRKKKVNWKLRYQWLWRIYIFQTIQWHPNSARTEKPQFQLTSAFAMRTMVCVLHNKTPILAHSYHLRCRRWCVSCKRKPLCQSTPATNTKMMVCVTYLGLFCNLILMFRKLLIMDYLVTLFQAIFGWYYNLLHLTLNILPRLSVACHTTISYIVL